MFLATSAIADVPEAKVTAVTESKAIIGDADDPAIWVHPTNPEASLVLGTDKYNGLHVFDLEGKEVAFFADGALNNVDMRAFNLAGETVWLASATERDDDNIVFYVIRADGSVERASPHAFPGIPDHPDKIKKIYGHAMARDPETGRVWALANFKTGHVAQYEVLDDNGQLKLELSRVLKVETQPEGMVADDKLGHLYVGEEDVAIWRFPLLPEAGDEAERIASIPSECFPRDDIEGLTFYDGAEGRYLVASSQGIHRAVFFPVVDGKVEDCAGMIEVAAGAVDGVTETDGLDIVSAPLGPKYPKGMLVMMDDQNEEFTTNFKFISAADVLEALSLK
ncbi:MAG: phytase [Thalassovita sp.]